jgi:hypothetical protein
LCPVDPEFPVSFLCPTCPTAGSRGDIEILGMGGGVRSFEPPTPPYLQLTTLSIGCRDPKMMAARQGQAVDGASGGFELGRHVDVFLFWVDGFGLSGLGLAGLAAIVGVVGVRHRRITVIIGRGFSTS